MLKLGDKVFFKEGTQYEGLIATVTTSGSRVVMLEPETAPKWALVTDLVKITEVPESEEVAEANPAVSVELIDDPRGSVEASKAISIKSAIKRLVEWF